jgi:hypothetical protein
LLTRGGEGEEGGGGGAKSYDGKKTWSSINHSILSVAAAFLLTSISGERHVYIYLLLINFRKSIDPVGFNKFSPANSIQ